eukprot:3972726-Pyramimonas_sp.AAC.1
MDDSVAQPSEGWRSWEDALTADGTDPPAATWLAQDCASNVKGARFNSNVYFLLARPMLNVKAF